jgi:hypothetical protein
MMFISKFIILLEMEQLQEPVVFNEIPPGGTVSDEGRGQLSITERIPSGLEDTTQDSSCIGKFLDIGIVLLVTFIGSRSDGCRR